jgi:hypothetical protein
MEHFSVRRGSRTHQNGVGVATTMNVVGPERAVSSIAVSTHTCDQNRPTIPCWGFEWSRLHLMGVLLPCLRRGLGTIPVGPVLTVKQQLWHRDGMMKAAIIPAGRQRWWKIQSPAANETNFEKELALSQSKTVR